ncbi:MAG: hypothetical protein ACLSGK_03475 [Lachnospiraceae bacterium]
MIIRERSKERRTKKKVKVIQTSGEVYQDDRFSFIAGYTSGGAPYGVTWEEMGLKPWEDQEENE